MAKAIGTILGSAFMMAVAKYLHNKRTRREWKSAAEELGLSYAHEGFGRSGLRLWGDVGGVEVLVYTERIPGKFGWKRLYTVFEISYGQQGLYEHEQKGVIGKSAELVSTLERLADQYLDETGDTLPA